jgi:hypothetical protein
MLTRDSATFESESANVSDRMDCDKGADGTVMDLDLRVSEKANQIVVDMTQLDIDFVSLFNVIYYISVGCFNLIPPAKPQWPRNRYKIPDDFPPEADPLALYKASKTLLLPDLSRRCLAYLKFTLTPENVTQRLFFDNDLQFHDEVVEIYVDYVFAHYDEIKLTDGWKEALKGDDAEDEMSRFRWSVMCRITQKLTFVVETGKDANMTNVG